MALSDKILDELTDISIGDRQDLYLYEWFKEEDVEPCTKMLDGNTHLTSLRIAATKIGGKGAAAFAKALRDCALTNINIDNSEIGDEGAAAWGQHLKGKNTLRTLTMANNAIGDSGVKSLVSSLGQSPLDKVELHRNNITDTGAKAIAQWLEGNRSLCMLNLITNPIGREGKEAIAEAAIASRSKNLIGIYMDDKSPELVEFLDQNRAETAPFTKKIMGGTQAGAFSIGERHELYFRANGIQRVAFEKNAEDRIGKFYESFDRFLDMIPCADVKNIKSPEDLLGNGRGHAALDNPRIWDQFPAICAKLSAQGTPLTLQHLNRKNFNHVSFLKNALSHAPLPLVMAGLNASGIRLQGKDLLENGKPNATFNALLENRGHAALFTANNWKGCPPQEIKRVMSFLPTVEREQVKNRHALVSGNHNNSPLAR